MIVRFGALWACLLVVSSSFAQTKYTVRKGDTIGAIAARTGVATNVILKANPGLKPERLKLGKTITIPKKAAVATARKPVASAGSGYSVRNGESDWTIAKRLGISVSKLHQLNPGVNWKNLQIGARLHVPGSVPKSVASKKPSSAVPVSKASGGRHVVRSGDNDWILARRYGVTVATLHRLNPGVKWSSLQIGQKLVVPGSTVATASGSSSSVIRTKRAIVTTDGVSVRRGAKTTASKIAVVSRGTQVAVLDRQGDWYKLRFPKGSVGWVRGDFLAPQKSSGYIASKPRSNPRVRTNTVASKSGLPKKSTSASGRVAYLSPSTGLSLLDSAASMLGTRYRYGSSSRSATDCSGYTSQVFRSQGIKIPRTSREQSKVGQSVSKSELKPGDLVFFNTRGSRISHVGIYKGNGQFYHASSGKGRVTVSSLNEGYYSRRYAGAKRVTNNLKPSASGQKSSAKKQTVDEDFEPAKEPESEDFDPKPETPATKPTPGTDEISR